MLARKAAAAGASDAIGVVVGQWERHLSLAHWAGAAGAPGTLGTASHTRANEVAHGLSALASSEVLAPLVLGGRLVLQLVDGRWSTGLTSGVLSSTRLARAESTGVGSGRETNGASEGRLGTLGSLGLGIQSKRGKRLLVATAESVGGWRRKRVKVLGGRVRLLRRGRAARGPGAGVGLVGRRHLDGGRVRLGGRMREAGSGRWRRVGETGSLQLCHLLLQSRIHHVLVLARHLVVSQIDSGLAGFLEQGVLLELLAIGSVRRVGERLLAHATAKVHVAELLGSEIEELLLKLLLALGQVDLGREKLGGDVGVDFTVLELELRGRKNLIVHHLLLAVLGGAGEAGANSSLRHALVSLVALASTDIVLTLTVRGGCRRLGRSGCLRGSTETSEEVGAAGARRRYLLSVLGDGSDFGRRGDAQAFERSTLAAGSKATGRHAETTGLEVVVGHLSKTASVHAHFVPLGVRTKSKAEQRGALGARGKIKKRIGIRRRARVSAGDCGGTGRGGYWYRTFAWADVTVVGRLAD